METRRITHFDFDGIDGDGRSARPAFGVSMDGAAPENRGALRNVTCVLVLTLAVAWGAVLIWVAAWGARTVLRAIAPSL